MPYVGLTPSAAANDVSAFSGDVSNAIGGVIVSIEHALSNFVGFACAMLTMSME